VAVRSVTDNRTVSWNEIVGWLAIHISGSKSGDHLQLRKAPRAPSVDGRQLFLGVIGEFARHSSSKLKARSCIDADRRQFDRAGLNWSCRRPDQPHFHSIGVTIKNLYFLIAS
jgi:hypothetical protein